MIDPTPAERKAWREEWKREAAQHGGVYLQSHELASLLDALGAAEFERDAYKALGEQSAQAVRDKNEMIERLGEVVNKNADALDAAEQREALLRRCLALVGHTKLGDEIRAALAE